MGSSAVKPVPKRTAVPEGKVRLCVIGFTLSHHTGRAAKLARAIQKHEPEKYETWFYFDSKGFRDEPVNLLKQIKSELSEEQQKKFESHKSSPFCWREYPDGKKEAMGGRDFFSEWAFKEFKDVPDIAKLAGKGPSLFEAMVDQTPGTANVATEAKTTALSEKKTVPEEAS
mmetsp:Transcript_10924/g.16310  ORF Transcript_10924/g.16310 Transcript_10924/m.16310 type:complete len:171 (+) Transcript_10924:40-552(+)|eukprot:CAMPEP_0167758066 /NCGR_PEP_ID=MMETSP0110_2-20121227/10267_1 /TAXON_ID=629695 /ORGANISM="Gymnochlora sp., Strain CCMP2014" /LENGTH=170 /DNA_ID=CAMNT_0007644311 /DNA_START=18 /DNA_END=527 /DNA_ORIENTATION=+